MIDLEAIDKKWLGICGACDAGIGACSHPAEDYRPVIVSLVAEVERLRAELLTGKTDPISARAETTRFREELDAVIADAIQLNLDRAWEAAQRTKAEAERDPAYDMRNETGTARWFHDCGADAVFKPDLGVWVGGWFQITSGTDMECAADCGSGSPEFYYGTSRHASDAIRAFTVPVVWR